MHESNNGLGVSDQQLSRRGFVGAAAAAAGGLALATRHSSGQPRVRPITAEVLEFGDRWTNESIGVAEFLRRLGCTVRPLDLGRKPAKSGGRAPDLIVFGSFTNNGPDYPKYVAQHAEALRDFVASGRVVLEMTQSDQFGNTVTYLPEGMLARRGDSDLAAVRAMAPDHPLVRPWFPEGGDAGETYFGINHPNWESFETWEGMRVLLASQESGRMPCLMEGAHGQGRFLASSLYIDKCFDSDGNPTRPAETIERAEAFFAAVVNYVNLVRRGSAPEVVPTPVPAEPATGPMIGHVDETTARVWFRPPPDRLDVRDWVCLVGPGRGRQTVRGRTDAAHDFTVVFDLKGLTPDSECRVSIAPAAVTSGTEAPYEAEFRTAPPRSDPARVVLGLGSCAPSSPDHVWTRILQEGCQGFVFLGDTPYVDTGDLALAREKHRRFLSQPEISKMIASMPCWGTWDDHDFGRNDGHGDFPGKHVCRLAFTEYRANATFGHDNRGEPQPDRFGSGLGIYTSFRRGPLEVFLIDPRWFSRTEPSWADSSKTTCIGAEQWAWLQDKLLSSDATFKALATGMIWDDKKNSESDDWHTYSHEREAIFDFIRDNRIPGCFLIGGDIHVSRALNYGPRVGYDLWQFIVSPLHGSTIPSLNVPHPSLVHDAVEPHTFLKLVADTTSGTPTLDATWINRDGRRIFEVNLRADRMVSS